MLSATAFAAFPSQTSSAGSGMATVNRADYQRLVNKVNVANMTIAALIKVSQITPWNDVKWLVASVDEVLVEAKAYAQSVGTDTVCELNLYIIDGQKVWLDPILILPVIIYP
jgi:hypothetical protein